MSLPQCQSGDVLCGVFVGGRSRRMEGFPKALLRAPGGETLVARAVRVAREAQLEPVIVGAIAGVELDGVPVLADAASEHGPLAGLVALLDAARDRRAPDVVALACDMPRVDAVLLRRIAHEGPGAAALAFRREGRWEPLCARYDAAKVGPLARARLAAGDLALQGLLDAAGATVIATDQNAWLDDVDTLEDAARVGLGRT